MINVNKPRTPRQLRAKYRQARRFRIKVTPCLGANRAFSSTLSTMIIMRRHLVGGAHTQPSPQGINKVNADDDDAAETESPPLPFPPEPSQTVVASPEERPSVTVVPRRVDALTG